MASWACSQCTFLNPPSQKSACQICLSPSPSSSAVAVSSSISASSSAAVRWPCGACTFSNPFASRACSVCGTRAAPFSTLVDLTLDPEDLSHPSIGSVFRPLQRCTTTTTAAATKRAPSDDLLEPREEKMARKEEDAPSTVAGSVDSTSGGSMLKIMSYNVWFREDLEVYKRMKAIGELIERHVPDLICFQEVTPNIYEIFQRSDWWKGYACSVSPELASERGYFCMQMSKLPVKSFSMKPFTNSIMGRELCLAEVDAGKDRTLVVATSHLESPCPAPPRWDQMYSAERGAQARESLVLLEGSPNAIFCGDMNWDDKLDGSFPLPKGWADAWVKLRRGDDEGWTYDTKGNAMLTGNRKLQKRLDRFVCTLQDFKMSGVEMIGTEAIPGISHCKEKKVKGEVQKMMLPVLPSDHFGLILTLRSL